MSKNFVYGPTFAEMRDPSLIKYDVRKQALALKLQQHRPFVGCCGFPSSVRWGRRRVLQHARWRYKQTRTP